MPLPPHPTTHQPTPPSPAHSSTHSPHNRTVPNSRSTSFTGFSQPSRMSTVVLRATPGLNSLVPGLSALDSVRTRLFALTEVSSTFMRETGTSVVVGLPDRAQANTLAGVLASDNWTVEEDGHLPRYTLVQHQAFMAWGPQEFVDLIQVRDIRRGFPPGGLRLANSLDEQVRGAGARGGGVGRAGRRRIWVDVQLEAERWLRNHDFRLDTGAGPVNLSVANPPTRGRGRGRGRGRSSSSRR